jgi:hypothetical protein
MIKETKLLCYALLFIAALTGCTGRKETDSVQQYLSWINDPEAGLVQRRQVNNLLLSVKYLPPQYLASRDRDLSPEGKDSMARYYSESKAFLLTITPLAAPDKEPGKSDVMFYDLKDFQEYKQRSHTMNFEMEEYVKLIAGNRTYHPVLSSLENTYGLEEGRNVYLVFSDDQRGKELNAAAELDIVFNDELFSTGLNHFVFRKEKLDNLPHLIF